MELAHWSSQLLLCISTSFLPTSPVTLMASTGCGGCSWLWVSDTHHFKSKHISHDCWLFLLCRNVCSSWPFFFGLQASCCSLEALLTTPECVNLPIPPTPLFPAQGYSSSIRGMLCYTGHTHHLSHVSCCTKFSHLLWVMRWKQEKNTFLTLLNYSKGHILLVLILFLIK